MNFLLSAYENMAESGRLRIVCIADALPRQSARGNLSKIFFMRGGISPPRKKGKFLKNLPSKIATESEMWSFFEEFAVRQKNFEKFFY